MAVYRLVSSDEKQLQYVPVGHFQLPQRVGTLVYLDVDVSDELLPHLDRWCTEMMIDYARIEGEGLRRSDIGLIAMDMDSTLITIECIDEIADFIGKKDQVARVTEAAMQGQVAFVEALQERVALLKGVSIDALDAVYNQRLALSPGAELMLEGFKSSGAYTLLVSGGFTFFTDRLKERLGLDEAYANHLEIQNGYLTGRVIGDVMDGTSKAAHVKRIKSMKFEQQVVQAHKVIAIGDGSNDRQMFAESDVGVAYHAKPVLEAVATHRIRFGGLDTLLAFFS